MSLFLLSIDLIGFYLGEVFPWPYFNLVFVSEHEARRQQAALRGACCRRARRRIRIMQDDLQISGRLTADCKSSVPPKRLCVIYYLCFVFVFLIYPSCSVCHIANSYVDILAVVATGRGLRYCQFGWQLSNILIG